MSKLIDIIDKIIAGCSKIHQSIKDKASDLYDNYLYYLTETSTKEFLYCYTQYKEKEAKYDFLYDSYLNYLNIKDLDILFDYLDTQILYDCSSGKYWYMNTGISLDNTQYQELSELQRMYEDNSWRWKKDAIAIADRFIYKYVKNNKLNRDKLNRHIIFVNIYLSKNIELQKREK